MRVKNYIEWQNLGCMKYLEAWRLQEGLRERRIAGEIPDRFLIVEHPPVFTLGKRDCDGDFISSMEQIRADEIEIVKCDRGGRITYHGPGQMVGYFIFSIDSQGIGIKDFVRSVEDVCIGVLSDFEIHASRDAEHPGVWVGREKIAAVGLNVSRGVTLHGFALNVNCDLAPYRHIVACGIKDRDVTSMEKMLGCHVPMSDVAASTIAQMRRTFDMDVVEIA